MSNIVCNILVNVPPLIDLSLSHVFKRILTIGALLFNNTNDNNSVLKLKGKELFEKTGTNPKQNKLFYFRAADGPWLHGILTYNIDKVELVCQCDLCKDSQNCFKNISILIYIEICVINSSYLFPLSIKRIVLLNCSTTSYLCRSPFPIIKSKIDTSMKTIVRFNTITVIIIVFPSKTNDEINLSYILKKYSINILKSLESKKKMTGSINRQLISIKTVLCDISRLYYGLAAAYTYLQKSTAQSKLFIHIHFYVMLLCPNVKTNSFMSISKFNITILGFGQFINVTPLISAGLNTSQASKNKSDGLNWL
ncbi:hypothetical protein AGLY_014504, partial [Aphis glycines]